MNKPVTLRLIYGCFLVVLISCLMHCASANITADTTSNKRKAQKDANDIQLSETDRSEVLLIDMLRRVPGLMVRGSGAYAEITIRGAKSVTQDSDPLFVIDGTPAGRVYSDVESLVNTNEIESIRVLKGPQASRYGARGGMGVIEIKTKKK